MELIVNQPVALPWSHRRGVQAVFWVRIYRDTHSAVVIFPMCQQIQGPVLQSRIFGFLCLL